MDRDYAPMPLVKGTFFLFGDRLYYKTRGHYRVINATEAASGWSFSTSTVSPYVPVILWQSNRFL